MSRQNNNKGEKMIIDTTEKVRALVADIMGSTPSFICIDTEFMRETTYWPQVCFIQIAFDGKAVIIDALAETDLHLLEPVLSNPRILKVFHAARQDIEIFYHLFHQLPQPLFDTQLAAMYLGYGDGIGYNTLVSEVLGKTIDKSLQYTDWSKRPATQKHIDYALSDVTYLEKAYKILEKKLAEKDRRSWVEEDMITAYPEALFEPNPEEAWARIKLRNHRNVSLSLIKDLATWREHLALHKNLARRRVLKDEVLIKLASEPLSSPEMLEKTLHASRSLIPRLGLSQDLLALIQNAVVDPTIILEDSKPLTLKQQEQYDTLRRHIDKRASDLELPPRVLTRKADLKSLAKGERDSLEVLKGWRRDVIGGELLTLLEGAPHP